MNALQIAPLLLAPLILSGCFSTPKEKTEYEKQIDAVPMPVTEAERLEQCRTFKLAADRQRAEDFLQYAQRSKLDTSDYDFPESNALLPRLRAMKCPGYGWFS
jgi:PBP1b-binding outer membrane lipoprotein LpoB